MSVLLFNPVAPAATPGNVTNNIYNATLGAAANSTVITSGKDSLVRLAFSGAVTVRFGLAANLTTNPAGATDMYFPAGVYIYDLGHQNDSLSIYSIAAATIVTVSCVVKN